MRTNIISYVLVGGAAALAGAGATYMSLSATPDEMPAAEVAQDQAQVAVVGPAAQTVLFETTMQDVLERVVMMREFERAPGTGSTPHRHPGSHTLGYVLEGTYEVQVDDGPLQQLGPGEIFYESPGALHAVSRNGSSTDPVRYLVITVSDPALPATVPE